MYLLLPIPYRSNDKLHSGFTLLAFGRVYLIIRLFRDFSPLWRRRLFFSAQMRTDKNLRRIPPQYHSYLVPIHSTINLRTVIKSYFHTHGLRTVVTIFLITILFGSYAIYLLERIYWWPYDTSTGLTPIPITGEEWVKLSPTEQSAYTQSALSSYLNSLLFTCAITTVGYGDIAPAGIRGRFVAILAAMLGIFTTSLMVGLITNKLIPTLWEDYLIKWETKENIRKEKENAAIHLIQSAYRYYQMNKEHKEHAKLNLLENENKMTSVVSQLHITTKSTYFSRSLPKIKKQKTIQEMGEDDMSLQKDKALLYTRHWVKKLREWRIKELAFENTHSTYSAPSPTTDSQAQILQALKNLDLKITTLCNLESKITDLQSQQQKMAFSLQEIISTVNK